MKMIFNYYANKTHFHNKGFALSLVLKVRFFGTRKWPSLLRWLNTVLAVSEYMSFANLWQEKGCSSQAETWQVENILMKDFDSQVKFDIFVVSMAT